MPKKRDQKLHQVDGVAPVTQDNIIALRSLLFRNKGVCIPLKLERDLGTVRARVLTYLVDWCYFLLNHPLHNRVVLEADGWFWCARKWIAQQTHFGINQVGKYEKELEKKGFLWSKMVKVKHHNRSPDDWDEDMGWLGEVKGRTECLNRKMFRLNLDKLWDYFEVEEVAPKEVLVEKVTTPPPAQAHQSNGQAYLKSRVAELDALPLDGEEEDQDEPVFCTAKQDTAGLHEEVDRNEEEWGDDEDLDGDRW